MTSDSVTWQAIRDEVMGRIRAGHYAPAALIPRESDLAAEFGCARATVNRALRDLAEAGFLERRRKAGTRVSADVVRRATLQIPMIRSEVEATGSQYRFDLLERTEAPPPAHVASRLGVPPDQRMLHLRSLHFMDDLPHLYEDRWVSLATVPAIADADLTRENPNEWLVRHAPYSHGSMSFGAEPAGDVAGSLACAPGDSVLVVERITWVGEAPITWMRQWHRPGYGISLSL